MARVVQATDAGPGGLGSEPLLAKTNVMCHNMLPAAGGEGDNGGCRFGQVKGSCGRPEAPSAPPSRRSVPPVLAKHNHVSLSLSLFHPC